MEGEFNIAKRLITIALRNDFRLRYEFSASQSNWKCGQQRAFPALIPIHLYELEIVTEFHFDGKMKICFPLTMSSSMRRRGKLDCFPRIGRNVKLLRH